MSEPKSTPDLLETIRAGYTFEGTALDLGAAVVDGQPHADTPVRVPLSVLNRHGLVAGATGTGKTKTLQLMAEQLSAQGVPVFLADIKGDLSGIVGLEKTLAFNVSGHVLHSIFWENLSPDGGDKPDGALGTAIDEHFGSFDKFRAQLTAATQTTQGSGWGVLAWEPIGKRLLVTQVYDHHGNVAAGMTPLLAFDAWEHAYYLQYKNVKPDYIEKLWDIVNWNDVSARLEKATKA